MWNHLPNATCTICKKSYTGGVYKQIKKDLVCEECVIRGMIFSGSTNEEIRKERREAKAESATLVF